MYQQIVANKRRSILLISAVVALVLLIGYVFGTISGNTPALLVMAGFLALTSTLTSWFAGDKIALTGSGAVSLPYDADPELHRIVENLAITAGIPTPKLYLLPDSALNAFATGRDPAHASIAVTAGLRQTLSKNELEGVLAHELSHIKNFDTRYLMLAITLVGFIAIASDFFIHSHLFGRNRDTKNTPPILIIVGLALAVLSPIIAKLLQLAISRRREFLADADGALLSRYPEGLASALEKIADANQMTTSASNATASLYFASPFPRSSRRLASLFSTHPPLEERITALRTMGGGA
ncbi:MAG: M48 family metallopeptidase [Patescibacteria group bacterium]|jgi:heat shock protein HtpX